MRYMELGQSGVKISKMGMGTWAIGGGPAWNGDLDTQVCIDTLAKGVEIGINLVDTAPNYNFGNSEVIVGKALKEIGRDKVILMTKCGLVWDERKGTPFNMVGDRQIYRNLRPESIRQEIEDSLTRLQTDYIDVYMTHWQAIEPCFNPIEETVGVLNELKKEGKIRAIGACNVDVDHVKEYCKYGELDIIQAKYNVLNRGIEKDLLPVCKDNRVTVQAYSPLEMGLLTGTIARDYVATGARVGKPWWEPSRMNKAIDMMEAWAPILEAHNCSIPTLALAWIMNQGDNLNLLSGATTPAQIEENAKAADIVLTEEEVLRMHELAIAAEK